MKLIVGTWVHGGDMMATTHAGEVDFGLEAAIGDVNSIRLKWFDHFMKGYPTDVLDGPPIELFVMGGGSGLQNAERRIEHGGAWRKVERWPLPETRFTAYYLHAAGTLSPEPPPADALPSTYTYNPADPVPTIGGNFQDTIGGLGGLGYGGAFDQRGKPDLVFCRDTLPLATRPDVLVFQTEPLEREIEVTGPIVVGYGSRRRRSTPTSPPSWWTSAPRPTTRRTGSR
jgi:putative CocE/NonD family hydrolase